MTLKLVRVNDFFKFQNFIFSIVLIDSKKQQKVEKDTVGFLKSLKNSLLSLLSGCLYPGNPYWKGKISMIGLLLARSDQLLSYTEKNIIFFFTNQDILVRRSYVLSLSLQLVFPVVAYHKSGHDVLN